MKKIYLLVILAIISAGSFAQTVDILNTPGQSGSSVVGQSTYHVSESIYTNEEIGATNFTSAATAIQKIGFFVDLLGGPTSMTNFSVYMKNVPIGVTTLATGAFSTTGYTAVFAGTFNAPTAGVASIILTAPFTRAANTNLQVLIIRANNVLSTGYVFGCAAGNTVGGIATPTALSSRRYNNTTAPVSGSTSCAATNFRPAIELVHTFPINASVVSIDFPPLSCYSTPQTVSVGVLNEGTLNIAAGAVTATLHMSGANTFSGTLTNPAIITAGSTGIINFTGVNMNNVGDNLDSVWISLASDPDQSRDTAVAGNTVAPLLSSYPIIEDAEGTLPVFPWIQQITGGQLWGLQTGAYTNTDQTLPLSPRAPGTTFYLFDSYSGANSTGFESRLFSNCIQVTAAASNPTLTFWMSHDNTAGLTTFLDSMYVSISTDHGVTWNRINGYQRQDATAATPLWRQETLNLSAYANQTIQIGFEGVSKYGNAFGLDDINISVSGTNATVDSIGLPNISCFSTPQTIAVRVANIGSSIIPAGTPVTLHVGGANTFAGTQNTAGAIAVGASTIVNFAGINLSNPGTNFDTAYITLASDINHLNDTLTTGSFTAGVISNYPIVEDVEGVLPVFPWVQQLNGDQLWGLQFGDYSNADQTVPLVARAPGITSYLFDSYTGATSTSGFASRLFSNCLQMPAAAANPTLTFWMSHDNYFITDLDSMYVSISTDKGVTWNRINGYRRPDATATTPLWRQETINLTAYANQTIQIGFEGVSKYGNAFSLDDINIGISGTNATIDSIGLPNVSCFSDPQTIVVRVANIGTTIIPAGTASITLHVSGANTFASTQPIGGAIPIGGTAQIDFAGIDLSNPGTMIDTAYITLATDISHGDDTASVDHFTATNLSTFPVVEDAETTFPVFSWIQSLVGDQLWQVNVGPWDVFEQGGPLNPLAPGNNFYLFNAYDLPPSGISSDGFVSRLFSNCIDMSPLNSRLPIYDGALLTFWMSHDHAFSVSPDPVLLDSVYVSISTDKGVTWNRVAGFQRNDGTLASPVWRMESVDLSVYVGQTIQIGFEGVSKFGNAIGIDNITIAGILPVALLNFDAHRNGKVNELSWKTSMEQNSNKFVIERSVDGGHTYSDIGKVNAAGNSNTERNYRFTDATPVKGINYYRLRIVDIDNSYKYSIIRNVRNEGSADFSFAPNPVEPQMKVKLDADNADKGTITITDMSGKLVYSNTISVAAGHNEIIIETGKFSQGSYIIKLQLSNDRIVKKFTKL